MSRLWGENEGRRHPDWGDVLLIILFGLMLLGIWRWHP